MCYHFPALVVVADSGVHDARTDACERVCNAMHVHKQVARLEQLLKKLTLASMCDREELVKERQATKT